MMWVFVAAAAGLALFYFLGRKGTSASDPSHASLSGYDTSTPDGAIQFLIELGAPDSFAMTEALLAFAIQGNYKEDINTLPVSEYDKAVNALAMFGGNDVRAGAIADGQRKIKDAARLAFHPGATITDRAYEQLAEATYNLGAVEAALVILMRMERQTMPWMQIRPALADSLGRLPEDASFNDWLKAAVAWRRKYLGGDATVRYDQAISTLT